MDADRVPALAAQPFDARCLSWQFPDELGRAATVSIWTVAGRLKVFRSWAIRAI